MGISSENEAGNIIFILCFDDGIVDSKWSIYKSLTLSWYIYLHNGKIEPDEIVAFF